MTTTPATAIPAMAPTESAICEPVGSGEEGVVVGAIVDAVSVELDEEGTDADVVPGLASSGTGSPGWTRGAVLAVSFCL